jgi:hypothetical protein
MKHCILVNLSHILLNAREEKRVKVTVEKAGEKETTRETKMKVGG